MTLNKELVYTDGLTARKWALNSAVECHPHTVEVVGSNPTAPTIHHFADAMETAASPRVLI